MYDGHSILVILFLSVSIFLTVFSMIQYIDYNITNSLDRKFPNMNTLFRSERIIRIIKCAEDSLTYFLSVFWKNKEVYILGKEVKLMIVTHNRREKPCFALCYPEYILSPSDTIVGKVTIAEGGHKHGVPVLCMLTIHNQSPQ